MIDIYCHSDNEAERMYAVDILFNELLAIPKDKYLIHFEENCTDYVVRCEGKTIIIRDCFFKKYSEPLSYMREENLPEALNYYHGLNLEIPIIYGEDVYIERSDTIEVGLDIFASTFFMLSRWEEFVYDREKFGKVNKDNLFCLKHNIGQRLIVHEYEDLLRQLFAKIGIVCRNNRQYKVIMSHDVDGMLTPTIMDMSKTIYRQMRYGLPKHKPAILSFREMLSYKMHFPNEYKQFQMYQDICDKYKIEEWFLFKVCDKGEKECTYRYDDNRVKRVINKLNKKVGTNVKLGFHPSQSTFQNRDQWKKETDRITNLLGYVPSCGRNHQMLYNSDTYQAWELMSMFSRSIVVSNTSVIPVGFRSGIAVPYPLFDVFRRRTMNVKELNCPIMDACIRLHNYHSIDKIRHDVCAVIDQVKKHKGILLLTWHIYIRNVALINKYYSLCEEIVSQAVRDI